jgi:PAS domain S-box-containing protein
MNEPLPRPTTCPVRPPPPPFGRGFPLLIGLFGTVGVLAADPLWRGAAFVGLVWLLWRCQAQGRAWRERWVATREAQLNSRLSALMREAADAILLADREGRLLEVNLAAERLYRFNPGEMAGMPLNALLPEGSRPTFEEQLRRLDGKESVFFDALHRRKDGTHVPVEVSLRRLAIGDESLIQCVVRDRTEARQRERLAQQQRLMALALGAAPDLSTGLSVALDGLIKLTGSTMGAIYLMDDSEPCLRLRLSTGLPPDFAERVATFPADHPGVRRIKGGGVIYSQAPHPGNPFPEWEGVPARFLAFLPIQQESTVIGCLPLAADRDDLDVETRIALETSVVQLGMAVARWRADEARARAEQQLRQAEKLEAVGQLAGGIAHDFNNLLGVILGCAEMLQLDDSDEATRRQFIAQIVEAAQHAGDLTKKLLAFARRGKYQNVPVAVHDLLEALVELIRRTFDPRVEIVKEFAAPAPMVLGDPGQLQTVFLNLALNARDAMPEGGRLTFATRLLTLDAAFCQRHHPQADPGEFVEVQVIDTGRGMPPEVLEHLFEPFYTTKSRAEGSGMGLAAVFGAVSLHRGTLRIASEPGRGTTVQVYLPLMPPAAPPEPAPGQPTGLRVMVIDDEELVRATFGRLLTGLGHRPLLFREGLEAIEFLRRDPAAVDLVILDLVLPGLAGPEVFRHVRTLAPDLPILIATGLSASAEAAALAAAGAVGLIQKPFRREELAAALAGLPPRPRRP